MISTAGKIAVDDVLTNFLRGEYSKATYALWHLNPEYTFTIATGAATFVYLKTFVPWRHRMYVYFLFFIHLRYILQEHFASTLTSVRIYINIVHSSRIPYNQSDLDLRRSVGSTISNPVIKRTYLALVLTSWALGKYSSFQ